MWGCPCTLPAVDCRSTFSRRRSCDGSFAHATVGTPDRTGRLERQKERTHTRNNIGKKLQNCLRQRAFNNVQGHPFPRTHTSHYYNEVIAAVLVSIETHWYMLHLKVWSQYKCVLARFATLRSPQLTLHFPEAPADGKITKS